MQKVRIMVVEDEALVAEDIKETLVFLGYEVPAVVSSGEGALAEIEKANPDLVLMDIMLAGEMDGIETAGLIQSRFEVPVVYVTAHADENTMKRARISVPFGYVMKPFDVRHLHNTIEMALYKHGLDRKLKESEARYREIVKDQTEMICRFLPNGTLTFVNDTYCRYFNRKREELIGQNWMAFVCEEDRDKVLRQIGFIKPGTPVVMSEHRVVLHNDDIRYHSSTYRATFDKDWHLTEIQSVGRDITERKQWEDALLRSKAEWESTFNALPDLLMILDEGHRITKINKAMAEKMGISPAQAAGSTCYELVHGADAPPHYCPHSMLLKDGKTHSSEFYDKRLGGYYWVSVTPLHSREGKFIGAVHVARDISEVRKMQKELEELKRDFEQRVSAEVEARLSREDNGR